MREFLSSTSKYLTTVGDRKFYGRLWLSRIVGFVAPIGVIDEPDLLVLAKNLGRHHSIHAACITSQSDPEPITIPITGAFSFAKPITSPFFDKPSFRTSLAASPKHQTGK